MAVTEGIDLPGNPPVRRVVVAAAALIAADGRILVAQRQPGKSFAGQWEFPGGKLEAGESEAAALVRELEEELGITARSLEPLVVVAHRYADLDLQMHVFMCRAWDGTARPCEGQVLAWHDLEGLAALDMPPADVPVIAALAARLLPGHDSPAMPPLTWRGRAT